MSTPSVTRVKNSKPLQSCSLQGAVSSGLSISTGNVDFLCSSVVLGLTCHTQSITMIPPPAPLRRSTTTATTLYTKNKRGRFVYSWRLSLVSEMTWRARVGYVNTGVGLQKAVTRKNICHRCGVDGTKPEYCCRLNGKRNKY